MQLECPDSHNSPIIKTVIHNLPATEADSNLLCTFLALFFYIYRRTDSIGHTMHHTLQDLFDGKHNCQN